LATWRNPEGRGVLAVVRPTPTGAPLSVASVGGRNFEAAPADKCFGPFQPEYWVHA